VVEYRDENVDILENLRDDRREDSIGCILRDDMLAEARDDPIFLVTSSQAEANFGSLLVGRKCTRHAAHFRIAKLSINRCSTNWKGAEGRNRSNDLLSPTSMFSR
jgi:hypothetical protein